MPHARDSRSLASVSGAAKRIPGGGHGVVGQSGDDLAILREQQVEGRFDVFRRDAVEAGQAGEIEQWVHGRWIAAKA